MLSPSPILMSFEPKKKKTKKTTTTTTAAMTMATTTTATTTTTAAVMTRAGPEKKSTSLTARNHFSFSPDSNLNVFDDRVQLGGFREPSSSISGTKSKFLADK